MRKMTLVAAISLMVGGLIATYGFQGRAAAAGQRSCSHQDVVHFTNATLRYGASVPVPQGCTDVLVLQLYLQLFNVSQNQQAHDASLATLQGRFDSLCRQIPQLRC
jgi:hypothetical protein